MNDEKDNFIKIKNSIKIKNATIQLIPSNEIINNADVIYTEPNFIRFLDENGNQIRYSGSYKVKENKK